MEPLRKNHQRASPLLGTRGGSGISARSGALTILVLLSLASILPLHHVSAGSLGQWTPTTNYPLSVAGESCVVYSGAVYCMGGFDAKGNDYPNTYYAPLSSSGVGQWTLSTPYSVAVDSASCVMANAVDYCVGGENSTSVLSNVYEAPVTASGFGKWTQAAAYPQTIAATACFAYSEYIYCVGGFDITGDETASSYYASVSSGLSSWMSTTSYPFAVNSEACMVQGDYVYCVAGNEESGLPQYPVNDVYYAQLSSSGIGAWTATAHYPQALSAVSCVLVSTDIYCAGGFNINELSSDEVYVGAVNGTGIASWTNSTSYPFPFDVSSCVTALSNDYCIAGRSYSGKQVTMTDQSYYAEVSGGPSQTSTTSSSSSSSTSSSSSSTSSSASSSSASSASTNSTSSTTTSTSTTPEFSGSALVLTTIVALSSVVILFRVRSERSESRRGN